MLAAAANGVKGNCIEDSTGVSGGLWNRACWIEVDSFNCLSLQHNNFLKQFDLRSSFDSQNKSLAREGH